MAHKSLGVAKLLTVMRKLSEEVNDQEICRRLEILMTSEKEDLPPSMVRELLQAPEKFDPSSVQDPYVQYIRHYLYMIKRAGHDKSRAAIAAVVASKPRSKKKTVKTQRKVAKKTHSSSAGRKRRKTSKKKAGSAKT